jgi:phage tail-like protein
MSTTNDSTGLYYPLTKMNFLVTCTETQGIAAFNEVTGIEASVDVIEFRQGNANSLAPIKIPGLVKHGNVTLKMGYTRDSAFKTWIQSCVHEQRGKMQVQDITIELLDITEGSPTQLYTETQNATLAWILKRAWVTKYTGADLNSTTSEVAIETVEIAYEELTIPN